MAYNGFGNGPYLFLSAAVHNKSPYIELLKNNSSKKSIPPLPGCSVEMMFAIASGVFHIQLLIYVLYNPTFSAKLAIIARAIILVAPSVIGSCIMPLAIDHAQIAIYIINKDVMDGAMAWETAITVSFIWDSIKLFISAKRSA